MSEDTKVAPAAAAPAPEPVDVAKVKSMLNLPEATTDVELIQTLVQLIAGLQYKYDALLADAVEMEDQVANRDLSDFDDLITNDSREFWKEQFLHNREQAINTLVQLRASHQPSAPAPKAQDPVPAQPAPEAPAPKPIFRNRLINPVRTMAELAGEPPAFSDSVAVRIRNRAQQIRTTEKIPFAAAFARAEKEINE